MEPNEIHPVSLFLRHDFALELDFGGEMREPLAEKDYATLCRVKLKRPFRWSDFHAENRRRAAYVIPRYMGYCYAVAPQATTPAPLVFDGVTWKLVEREGLFEDFIRRLKVATGIDEDGRLPIMPSTPQGPSADLRLPPALAVHDRTTCCVEILAALPSWCFLQQQHRTSSKTL